MLQDLTTLQWITAAICGVLIGMSKSGLSGAGLFIVPVMAGIFGGRPSVGLVLPMLIVADIFAVSYYHRHADWKHILRLLPWAAAGVLIALVTGKIINDEQFRRLIGVLVILGILIMIWQDIRKNQTKIPSSVWYSSTLGLSGGFATMIGNAAGPIMSLYMLSMRLPKNNYIGTTAWFFCIINLFKFPLHVFVWKTITPATLYFNLFMVIPIIAGAIGGIYIVKLIPERFYRIFIIVSTVASAAFLF